ncbi:M20 metallopeptidase family protein [Streptomyces vietnamensis]|uniref:Amidohydrolase n=1 Tax=Streptomyces vietnamensis TaxID=362257 RepID=A0A0B5HY46_9ACTN|nr:M20 family metallopeptidase [Streptomyces vietnamensis]AJF63242.1 amidohydrolase [Streptomyces vietnamensis]
MNLLDDLLDDTGDMAGDLIRLRRSLHREPEVGLALPRTQEKVLAALDSLPVAVTQGRSLSSVTAVLKGARPGPTVLLRADMDALPIAEQTGLPFESRFTDRMHACGHDLHTAMLVGAAQLLAQRADRMAGQVVLMFQPGEEGGHDGAALMLQEGVLEAAGDRPVAAYALHVSARHYPRGRFATRPGPLMAACARLDVTVHGSGGHGSAPHHARNPIPAACAMVGELHAYLSRGVDPLQPVALSVGTIHAGTAANVVPATAHFQATVRTFDPAVSDQLARALPRLCEAVAAAHGVRAEARYLVEYPATIPTPEESLFAADVTRELFGERRYQDMAQPLTASEDFSRVLDQVPGTIVQLGAAPAGQSLEHGPGNHSPHVVFDDHLVADGAALYAGLALARLLREPGPADRPLG